MRLCSIWIGLLPVGVCLLSVLRRCTVRVALLLPVGILRSRSIGIIRIVGSHSRLCRSVGIYRRSWGGDSAWISWSRSCPAVRIIRVVDAGLSGDGLLAGKLLLRHARLSRLSWLTGKSQLSRHSWLARQTGPGHCHRRETLRIGSGQAADEITEVIPMLGPIILEAGLKQIFRKLKGNWNKERRSCAGAEHDGTEQQHHNPLPSPFRRLSHGTCDSHHQLPPVLSRTSGRAGKRFSSL